MLSYHTSMCVYNIMRIYIYIDIYIRTCFIYIYIYTHTHGSACIIRV